MPPDRGAAAPRSVTSICSFCDLKTHTHNPRRCHVVYGVTIADCIRLPNVCGANFYLFQELHQALQLSHVLSAGLPPTRPQQTETHTRNSVSLGPPAGPLSHVHDLKCHLPHPGQARLGPGVAPSPRTRGRLLWARTRGPASRGIPLL